MAARRTGLSVWQSGRSSSPASVSSGATSSSGPVVTATFMSTSFEEARVAKASSLRVSRSSAVKKDRRRRLHQRWPAWLPVWLGGQRVVPVATTSATTYRDVDTMPIPNSAPVTPVASPLSDVDVAMRSAISTPSSQLFLYSYDYTAMPILETGLAALASNADLAYCSFSPTAPSGNTNCSDHCALHHQASIESFAVGTQPSIKLVKSPDATYPPTTDYVMDLTRLDDADYFCTQVHALVKTLLPDWHDVERASALEITRLSGALTNRVYEVRTRDPNDTKHTSRRVLLRVYGNGVDQLFSRDKELDLLRKLSAVGLGPRLLAVFGNGRLEEYFRSVTLSHSDIRTPELSSQIAQRLAQLHCLVRTYPPQEDESHMCSWIKSIHQWLPMARQAVATSAQIDSEQSSGRRVNISTLHSLLVRLDRELDALKERAMQVASPIVLAHNDLQYGNILRLRDAPHDLVLIDYEYAGYNPRGYDIANHFCEWTANYHGNTPDRLDPDCFPSVMEQEHFLRAYLTEWHNRAPTTEEVAQLQREVDCYVPCSHLVWALWGLLQANRQDIDFDYLSYGTQRLQLALTHSV